MVRKKVNPHFSNSLRENHFQYYLFRHRTPVINDKQVSVTGRVPKPIDFECASIERVFDPVSYQLMGKAGQGETGETVVPGETV